MWLQVERHLKGRHALLAVARVLIKNGLSVRNGGIYCNDLEISAKTVADAAQVDRREVAKFISVISEQKDLRYTFEHIRNAGPSLIELAKSRGFGVVVIKSTNATTPGILAKASTLVAHQGISIRQAIVDDPELSPEPTLTIIAERKIPGQLYEEFKKIPGVSSVELVE